MHVLARGRANFGHTKRKMTDTSTGANNAPTLAAAHGKRGEDIAAALLVANGYKILARNIRFGRAEIDLVCQDEHVLVCVEVKARNSAKFGFPEQFVTPRKQELLVEALDAYALQHNWTGRKRFDEVGIILTEDGYHATIFRDIAY